VRPLRERSKKNTRQVELRQMKTTCHFSSALINQKVPLANLSDIKNEDKNVENLPQLYCFSGCTTHTTSKDGVVGPRERER
jgi:hypothetical protein